MQALTDMAISVIGITPIMVLAIGYVAGWDTIKQIISKPEPTAPIIEQALKQMDNDFAANCGEAIE